MKQRVAIARSLAYDPDVLLMDEPFAALDAQTREILQGELLRIWEESGKTIVFITHGIDEAVYLGQRVAVMTSRPGRIKQVIDIPLESARARKTSARRRNSLSYGMRFGVCCATSSAKQILNASASRAPPPEFRENPERSHDKTDPLQRVRHELRRPSVARFVDASP